MSTADLKATLRTHLLTFTRLQGDTLADILGRTTTGAGSDGKFFWRRAPDNVTKPEYAPSRWAVALLKNGRANAESPVRWIWDLEVTLFGRPTNQEAALDEAADACDEAMLAYVNNSDDLVGSWGKMRSTMPVFPSPADSEVVQIRLVYPLVVYAGNLLQYHD